MTLGCQKVQRGGVVKFDIVMPEEFNYYLTKSKRLEFVTVYPEVFLAKCILLLTDREGDGAGFGITPDKELFNLFNNTLTKKLGGVMVRNAVGLGAVKLFCFDGFLKEYYEYFGFRVVKREPWNPEFAPVGWNYEKYGKPDVVWMEL